MKKVLICGGRDFTDYDFLCWAMDDFRRIHGITHVIHGGARGADTLGGSWATKHGLEVDIYLADWEKYGNAAGPIRNQRMLDEGKPDMVVAFYGGTGTADMVRRAKSSHILTIQIVTKTEGTTYHIPAPTRCTGT